MRDEFFDDTCVNSGRRNRDLPECAGPVRDGCFDDTYVNSGRRNRDFFSGSPKCAGPVRD